MNKLPLETRVRILSLLVEGASLRSISRVCGVSINTVTKLLVDAGKVCAEFHFNHVQGVQSRFVQCDEIWSFCYSKQANTPAGYSGTRGDVWTWTGLDADSKLMISWMVGDRGAETANIFVQDLADRLGSRVQLTTDGYRPYLKAVEGAFGNDIDYAMLVKLYSDDFDRGRASAERRYSPARCIGTRVETIAGAPNAHYTSTSYAERHNLTMRMSMRRFTRLTNAFSKKVDNHCHSLALYFTWYNWVRTHTALAVEIEGQKGQKRTPAMAAGLIDRALTMTDIVSLIDANDQRTIARRRQELLAAPQSK